LRIIDLTYTSEYKHSVRIVKYWFEAPYSLECARGEPFSRELGSRVEFRIVEEIMLEITEKNGTLCLDLSEGDAEKVRGLVVV
jgi:hypothetical protein